MGYSLGVLVHLKTKTISVVFFSCFKKFKCLGDVLDSVSLLPFATFEVTTFGRFYHSAQNLIWHSIFLLSENWNVVKYLFDHVGSYKKMVRIILLDNFKIHVIVM